MSFDKAMQKLKFDTRLLDYNLATGVITQEEYNKHLAELADDSINTIKVTLDDDSDDIDAIDDIDEQEDLNESDELDESGEVDESEDDLESEDSNPTQH